MWPSGVLSFCVSGFGVVVDEQGYDYRRSHIGRAEIYERVYSMGYERWQWDLVERPIVRSILDGLRADGARSLLDFACGTGRIAGEARELFPVVEGIDVAEDMLALARARYPDVRFEQIDITRQPLERRFDVVAAFRFFMNAQPALRLEALDAIREHLTPGGVLVANVHANSTSPLGIFHTIRAPIRHQAMPTAWSYRSFERTLNERDFEIVRAWWHTYWPRAGDHFVGIARSMLPKAEQFARRAHLPRWLAQSFIVEARPR